MDPSQGERYTETVKDEDPDVLDHIYNITAKEEDYVDPTAEGIMDWQYDNPCMTDSDDGLENWQNRLYELHGDGLVHRHDPYLFLMVRQTQKSLLCNSQSRYKTPKKWRL